MDTTLLSKYSQGDLEMTHTFDLNPESLWLEIPQTAQDLAWKQASLLPAQAQQRTYLNLLCQTTLLSQSAEQLGEPWADVTLIENQSFFWELGINGFSVLLDAQRFVIVPSDALEIDEFRIPQEWVDIPNLVADYYLAAQVDPTGKLIRIWGYTSHRHLKEMGHYDPCDRTYSLARDAVIEDINSLWLRRQHFSAEPTQSPILETSSVSLDALTQGLEKLANPTLIFPRRAVAFDLWAAIVSNENWRQMLVERRRQLANPSAESEAVNHLGQWFENRFEAGWQTIHQYISPNLIGAFMVNQVKRAKLLDLTLELLNYQVALMITLGKAEHSTTVQASVYPTGEQIALPPNLKLSILTQTGEVFKEVTSRSDDEFIRYKFDANSGDRFSVSVALGSSSITEMFQV
jgi:Protein of unknown function (DUF1822)